MTSAAPFVVFVDSREQTPPPMPPGVALARATMSEADYTTAALQGIGVIERKSASDFAGSITHGRERFDDEIRRLQAYRFKAIIVEGCIDDVCRAACVHVNSVLGTVASFFARSDLPTLFAGSPAGCGRLIVGILKRWEERIAAEAAAEAEGP